MGTRLVVRCAVYVCTPKVFSGPLVVFVPGFPWHVMCASLEVFIFVRFICRKVGAAL